MVYVSQGHIDFLEMREKALKKNRVSYLIVHKSQIVLYAKGEPREVGGWPWSPKIILKFLCSLTFAPTQIFLFYIGDPAATRVTFLF